MARLPGGILRHDHREVLGSQKSFKASMKCLLRLGVKPVFVDERELPHEWQNGVVGKALAAKNPTLDLVFEIRQEH
jgi:dTDP-4-amino-4,6-dideoxygalactose transaminase